MAKLTTQEDTPFNVFTAKMDMRELYEQKFAVAVSTGNLDDYGLIITSLKGPYDFSDMVNEVLRLHEQKDNAKVVLMSTNLEKKTKLLSPETIEYIQHNGADILLEETFGLVDEKGYNCKARLF